MALIEAVRRARDSRFARKPDRRGGGAARRRNRPARGRPLRRVHRRLRGVRAARRRQEPLQRQGRAQGRRRRHRRARPGDRGRRRRASSASSTRSSSRSTAPTTRAASAPTPSSACASPSPRPPPTRPTCRCSATSADRTRTSCPFRCSTSSTAARTPTTASTCRSSSSRRSAPTTFAEALRWGTETYHVLKGELRRPRATRPASATRAASPPTCPATARASTSSSQAIEKAGFTPGTDIALGLDVAATEFFKDGVVPLRGQGLDGRGAHRVLRRPRRRLPDRHDRGRARRGRLGRLEGTSPRSSASKIQLVGDDLFVTNPTRLADGIKRGVANSLLVKVNQIGTLSETLDAVDMAHRAGYTTMFSHRSGETEDTTIADLVGRDRTRVRSRAARPPAASASRNTISFCASRRSWATRRSSPAARPSRASRADSSEPH